MTETAAALASTIPAVASLAMSAAIPIVALAGAGAIAYVLLAE